MGNYNSKNVKFNKVEKQIISPPEYNEFTGLEEKLIEFLDKNKNTCDTINIAIETENILFIRYLISLGYNPVRNSIYIALKTIDIEKISYIYNIIGKISPDYSSASSIEIETLDIDKQKIILDWIQSKKDLYYQLKILLSILLRRTDKIESLMWFVNNNFKLSTVELNYLTYNEKLSNKEKSEILRMFTR